MKSVLMSIQPKWCDRIADGKKTIDVRKTTPDVPFKCYIYCTKQTRAHALHLYISSGWGRQEIGIIEYWRSRKEIVDVNSHLPAYRYNIYLAEGKVIGEFVCDKVDTYCYRDFGYEISEETFNKTMLTGDEFCGYGKGKTLYGLHISDLKIYDKPRKLSEFTSALSLKDIRCKHIEKRYRIYDGKPYIKCTLQNCRCEFRRLGWQTDCDGYERLKEPAPLTRAPQSWCYVAEP